MERSGKSEDARSYTEFCFDRKEMKIISKTTFKIVEIKLTPIKFDFPSSPKKVLLSQNE